jgi:histidine ammonia-lyase
VNIANEILASHERSLDGNSLRIADVAAIARGDHSVRLDDAVLERMRASRAGLEALAEKGTPIYGVNTGF